MKEFFVKNKKSIIALFLWLMIFAVYCFTKSPSVGFIDSGELAADVITLGIAHPTGYPLFTLLGRLFSQLPIAREEIVRLNIFSALLTSLAASVFFVLMTELLENRKDEKQNTVITASLFAACALAFSRTFWFQGLAIEVYSLHLLLICTVIYLFVRAVKTAEARWWLLFAFMVGLSFTNHLTTILLAPGLLFWFFSSHGLNKNAWKRIFVLAIPFLMGLSVYLYLPIRASQHPLFNWGNPQTVEKFWWHVTGKQFRVFMFSSGEAAQKQLDYFISNLPNEFNVFMLVLAAAGLFSLLFSDRKKFFFVMLLGATCIAYSINYDIHDIDSYFLLAFISIAIFIAFGVERILRGFRSIFSMSIIFIFLVLLIGFHLERNIPSVDQSGNYLVEEYTKNILLNLPKNSIVLSYQWDYFVAPSYYYQHVKNIRPDVVVIDKELLRRSWYFPQLKIMYPEIMNNSKIEAELFQQELYKFEHDLPYDFAAIEGRYTALLKSILEKNETRTLYVTPEIEPQYTVGYNRIPECFLYRLKKDTTYSVAVFPSMVFTENPDIDVYSRQIKMFMVNGLKRREMYERFHGKDSLANLYRLKASEITLKHTPNVSNF